MRPRLAPTKFLRTRLERRPQTASQVEAEKVWRPFPDRDGLPSPQRIALDSQADILGYGGAAGGGKSFLLLGAAILGHRRAMIFRREYEQLKDLIESSIDIIGDHGKLNRNEKVWRLDSGRRLEFGASKQESDVAKFKGRARDYLGIDEATEFTEHQIRFLLGWLRTEIPGQRCRAILTFNPPTTKEGEWVISFFGPWLDKKHPRPAKPGELRWYATIEGRDVERPNGEPFEHTYKDGRTETIRPMSRTFVPSRVTDNPIYMQTGYVRTLQNLPEPLRSQLLEGDFTAGLIPDRWQAIPTAWVRAAMDRWRGYVDDGLVGLGPMDSVGVDVAHGGTARTVVAPRYGDFIDSLAVFPGHETPTGLAAARLVMDIIDPGAVAFVDAIGYGASCAERLADPPPEGFGIHAVPVNVGDPSKHRDRSGKFKIANLRSELYWRIREWLDPEFDSNAMLPDDPELLSDLCEFKYALTTKGIAIEDKDAVAKRLGRSPDRGDAVALTMMPIIPGGGLPTPGGTGFKTLKDMHE